jgi:prepilin-type processing-associated H-X9-DG protein
MDDNLIGYLLDSLSDVEKRQVEAHLAESADARRRLAVLKQALRPLSADQEEIVPPAGLAARTLAAITAKVGPDLPQAPRVSASSGGSGGWWRRADVIVAAGLLLLVAGAAAPLIYRWHSQRANVECQDNLRQFFVALAIYHDQQGDYPDLAREAPRNVAGLVVPVLADAGVLPASFTVRCPAVGPHLGCTLTVPGLQAMSADQFQTQAPNLSLCYAFALGYRDSTGDYHGPWQTPGSLWPILADRPPSDGSPGNSPNHGGVGQNVLFLDGHVRFVPGRTIGDPDDDIYLNRDNRVAAGLDDRDKVLGSSAVFP